MSAGDAWISYGGDRFVEVERGEAIAGVFPVKFSGPEGVRWYSVSEIRARSIWPKCVDCDEAGGSCPGGRCRDCDLGWLAR